MYNTPTTSKAYAFPVDENPTGIRDLHLIEIPTPKPGPGQVLVSVKAISLNYT